MALLVFASSALAEHSSGAFAKFGECPLASPTINDCVYSVSDGGSVTIGAKTVPLKNPVTLQGGYAGAGEHIRFYGAESGNTLSKTRQPVPGGLSGIDVPSWWPEAIQEWFSDSVDNGSTGVGATLELAGVTKGHLADVKLDTEHLLFEEGIALRLPTRIHLENPILGANCHIGSARRPIRLNFTTGKSGNLVGRAGEVTFNQSFTITTNTGGRLVSNTFAAPEAEGCGGIFSFFVDPLVNSTLGTPSPSEANSAVLEGTLEDARAAAVKASE